MPNLTLREKLLIEAGFYELSDLPAEEQNEILGKLTPSDTIGEDDLIQYEYDRGKVNKRNPLEISREDVAELALLKNISVCRKMNQKQRTIKHILVFFCVLTVINLIGMIILVAKLLGG